MHILNRYLSYGLLSIGIVTVTATAPAVSVPAAQSKRGPVTKSINDVFAKWLTAQAIVPKCDLTNMRDEINGDALRTHYKKHIVALEPLTQLLDVITKSTINQYGFTLKSELPDDLKTNFSDAYTLIERDLPTFIQFLRQTSISSTENMLADSASTNSDPIVEKYTAFIKLLFHHPDAVKQHTYLINVANRFFDFCFEPPTFPLFERMMLLPEYQPIARMFQSVVWQNLSGFGWRHWHEESLKELRARADLGHRIRYIAGGSDILQLIKAGIYNVTIIDPQLPTQPKYYTNDWEYLLIGNIGDKITVPLDERTITMERYAFDLPGTTFKARVNSGNILELQHSTTIWRIVDEDGNDIGSYRFERRFCNQDDFKVGDKETLLMSLNELAYAVLPDVLPEYWDVDITKLPQDMNIIIKQLDKPVTRDMMINMRIATLLNASDLKYISLGSCIN